MNILPYGAGGKPHSLPPLRGRGGQGVRLRWAILLLLLAFSAQAQTLPPPPLWHNQPRTLRYRPEGTDFVIANGTHRFTRALYGTNTAFRVEAGDLPEFALYLPGMGGNLTFGFWRVGRVSGWLKPIIS